MLPPPSIIRRPTPRSDRSRADALHFDVRGGVDDNRRTTKLPTQMVGDFGRAVDQLFGVAGGEERRARVELAAVPRRDRSRRRSKGQVAWSQRCR